jgi:hypothetical protein
MPLASGVHLGKNLEENLLNNTIKMYFNHLGFMRGEGGRVVIRGERN